MKFCPECGKDLKGSSKFCPECGFNLSSVTQNKLEPISEKSSPTSDEYEEYEEPVKRTTRELGNNLEEEVGRIFKNRGYETMLRQKLRGLKSNQLNEIDILAKRGKVTVAIECKNYNDDRKVGIAEIRDFVGKLDDLGLNRGYFVTTSDFSTDAAGWAEHNPSEAQLELWDGSTFMEQYKSTVLGRNGVKVTQIENCIEPQSSMEDYTQLALKNPEDVIVRRQELIFHPFYIVSFDFSENFKTPDKKIHAAHNSGEYFVDGLSSEIIYHKDENGYVFSTSDDEEKQFVHDIETFEAKSNLPIIERAGLTIKKNDPAISPKDAEFKARSQIRKDNMYKVPYEVRVSREEVETRDYPYVPNSNQIRIKSRLVYVPKVEIEFESKEYTYLRIIFPASEIWIKDEIAKCRHFMRTKDTFAVCDVCGIAKCEKDIVIDESKELCYCKKHIPEEIKEKSKGDSFTGKVKKKFSFRK